MLKYLIPSELGLYLEKEKLLHTGTTGSYTYVHCHNVQRNNAVVSSSNIMINVDASEILYSN
jgi:hypothetical protein